MGQSLITIFKDHMLLVVPGINCYVLLIFSADLMGSGAVAIGNAVRRSVSAMVLGDFAALTISYHCRHV